MPGIDDAVIMPVFNEEATVRSVLDAVRAFFHGELIVVDDGSTDTTPAILAERDDILVVRHPENMGYGKSLIDGFTFASFAGLKRVITMDCDGQHEPAHIPEFFEVMDGTDAQVISGSRYLPGSTGTSEAPADRREVNERVTAEINRVTGWGITDAFCGFKGYQLEAIVALGLSEPGYAMPMELWAKAHRRGYKVVELPVERIYCDFGRSFGEELDDPETRFEHYMEVWRKHLEG